MSSLAMMMAEMYWDLDLVLVIQLEQRMVCQRVHWLESQTQTELWREQGLGVWTQLVSHWGSEMELLFPLEQPMDFW